MLTLRLKFVIIEENINSLKLFHFKSRSQSLGQRFLVRFWPPMPQDPTGASPAPPSLTRSDPALIDSITPPLYYITSPFTKLKQLRARLGLRPCQREETLNGRGKKKTTTSERHVDLQGVCLRRWREREDRGGGERKGKIENR